MQSLIKKGTNKVAIGLIAFFLILHTTASLGQAQVFLPDFFKKSTSLFYQATKIHFPIETACVYGYKVYEIEIYSPKNVQVRSTGTLPQPYSSNLDSMYQKFAQFVDFSRVPHSKKPIRITQSILFENGGYYGPCERDKFESNIAPLRVAVEKERRLFTTKDGTSYKPFIYLDGVYYLAPRYIVPPSF